MSDWIKSAHVVGWLGIVTVVTYVIYTEATRVELPKGVVAYTDVVYKRAPWRQQKLDVYVPDARQNQPLPAIVAIHGGSWRGGTKNSYGREVSRLVNYGYVVISVDYILSTRNHPGWPENLDDVKDAVRWVRRHASEYGIDSRRVVAYGSSAGGHLATLLGTHAQGSDPETEVQAVVDLYGPSDLADLVRNPRALEALEMLFGKKPNEAPELYRAASPLSHVSSTTVPMLLIHGEDDDSVPVAHSTRLGEQLAAAGVPSRVIVLKGAGHSFKLDGEGLNLVPRIVGFLDQTLAPVASARAEVNRK